MPRLLLVGVWCWMGLTGCEEIAMLESLGALDEDWGVQDDDDFVAALKENGPALLEATNTPGAMVVLVADGVVVRGQSLGDAGSQSRSSMRPDQAVFQVASLSKAVTAWAVARAVEEGHLTWDEPVVDRLTRWELPDNGYDASKITAVRLLNHRAGLTVTGFVGWTPEQTIPSLEEVLDGTASSFGEGVEVAWEPGTERNYSGGGYALAQLLVEEVTGASFEDWAATEVIEPLGLKMRFGYDAELASELVVGHDRLGQPLEDYRFRAVAAAGLYSTAVDYAEFVAAMVDSSTAQRGRGVLDPITVDRLLAGDLGVNDTEMSGVELLTHTGANQGWRTAFAIDPITADGVVVFTNGDNGDLVYEKILAEWANAR